MKQVMIPVLVIVFSFSLLVLNVENVDALDHSPDETHPSLIPLEIDGDEGKIDSVILDKNNEVQFVVINADKEEETDSTGEFFSQILLIVIPSLIGMAATKWVVNDWQVRSDLLKTKKEILAEYDKSTKRLAILIDNYITDSTKDDEELKNFVKELKEIRFASNSFISSIRLYYRNDEMEKEVRKINEILFEIFIKMREVENQNALQSDSTFMEFYREKQELHRELIKKFELELVDTKLHKHKI